MDKLTNLISKVSFMTNEYIATRASMSKSFIDTSLFHSARPSIELAKESNPFAEKHDK